MTQRSPHSASYTDVNGNHHYREFASERAANKWLWETMPARDIKLQNANWERNAKRAEKSYERQYEREHAARQTSTYSGTSSAPSIRYSSAGSGPAPAGSSGVGASSGGSCLGIVGAIVLFLAGALLAGIGSLASGVFTQASMKPDAVWVFLVRAGAFLMIASAVLLLWTLISALLRAAESGSGQVAPVKAAPERSAVAEPEPPPAAVLPPDVSGRVPAPPD